jgi:hypothetical protein
VSDRSHLRGAPFARRVFVALAIGRGLLATPIPAQEMEIPVATQIPLFFKVLAFDRNVDAKQSNELVIAVAFQSGNRQSTTAKNEVTRVLADLTDADARTVRAVTIDLDREDLRATLRDVHAAMLYVTPLRGVAIDDIATITREARVRTFTGVPKYISQGLAVGVRRLGDRPKLMVNLRVARLEGADFSAEFLKLAQVVQE